MLKLPIPAKSTQLLGKEFVGDEGRGANLIDIGKGTVVVRTLSTFAYKRTRHESIPVLTRGRARISASAVRAHVLHVRAGAAVQRGSPGRER